ncbi:MAG: hypothetical protein RLZZ621_824 [Gemmatimonadota bacterium]
MPDDQITGEPTSPAGAASWLTIQDDLLRALAHSVSNRVGTILAFTGTLELGAPASAQTVTILREEAERLEQLLQQLRLLPRPEDSAIEPMLLPDALTQAWALVAELSALRDATLTVEGAADAPPIRAEAAAVVQACAAAFAAASVPGTKAITVQLEAIGEGRTQMLECRVLGAADPSRRQQHATAIGWLLSPSQGTAIDRDGVCGFRVPTLMATRR